MLSAFPSNSGAPRAVRPGRGFGAILIRIGGSGSGDSSGESTTDDSVVKVCVSVVGTESSDDSGERAVGIDSGEEAMEVKGDSCVVGGWTMGEGVPTGVDTEVVGSFSTRLTSSNTVLAERALSR